MNDAKRKIEKGGGRKTVSEWERKGEKDKEKLRKSSKDTQKAPKSMDKFIWFVMAKHSFYQKCTAD